MGGGSANIVGKYVYPQLVCTVVGQIHTNTGSQLYTEVGGLTARVSLSSAQERWLESSSCSTRSIGLCTINTENCVRVWRFLDGCWWGCCSGGGGGRKGRRGRGAQNFFLLSVFVEALRERGPRFAVVTLFGRDSLELGSWTRDPPLQDNSSSWACSELRSDILEKKNIRVVLMIAN